MGTLREALLSEPSFRNWQAYRGALWQNYPRFRGRLFARSTVESETGELVRRSKNEMKRTLNWWDMMWFSIGAVVGAGIFVITGIQARDFAGPAILLSYVAAGFSSMLSVFTYTELALEVPTAGGSFAYLRVELGDIVALIAAANVVMEYAVGTGAVARAWTSYFATLINEHPDQLQIYTALAQGSSLLHPIAVGVIWITGLIAAASTRAMSTVNYIASAANALLISFIIIAGLAHANPANYAPFMPLGVRGVFSAAAIVYFAYLGFDAVATLAEETKHPARDIPIGLVGSMVMVTVIYCLMALTLSLMQKYTAIDTDAPFSAAFRSIGWTWAQYLVSLGALKGMTTVLLVRRHYMPGETSPQRTWLLVFLIFVIFAVSVGFAVYWALSDGWIGHAILGGFWFGATWCMWYFLPIVRTPKVWGVPWIPWIPAASIGTNCFLLGSIDRDSFIRFGVFTAMIIVYNAFVGLHASYDAAIHSSAGGLEINSSTKADPNHIDATTPAPERKQY